MEASWPLPRFSAALSPLQGAPNTMWEPIVARARKGDLSAKEEIARVHYRQIYYLVSRLVHDRDLAVDLTQETFLRAFERLDELHTAASLSWWLKSIATNLCRDSYRRRQRFRCVPFQKTFGDDPEQSEAWEPVDASLSPEDLAMQAEVQRRVRGALRSLPRKQKEVVVLHHLEGMRVEDIAATIGCAVGTVKSRLARGRARLFAELRPLVA